jgi:hypothetical protein
MVVVAAATDNLALGHISNLVQQLLSHVVSCAAVI